VPIRQERTYKMNEYWMEIVGKILLFGGFFIGFVSNLYLMAFDFKIKYQSAFSFIILPTFALIRKDFRNDSKVLISLLLWGASLPMVIWGAYCLN